MCCMCLGKTESIHKFFFNEIAHVVTSAPKWENHAGSLIGTRFLYSGKQFSFFFLHNTVYSFGSPRPSERPPARVTSSCNFAYRLFRELGAVNLGSTCQIHGSPAATATAPPPQLPTEESVDALCNTLHHWHHCPELYKAIEGIRFIADHTKREEDSTRVNIIMKTVREGTLRRIRTFLWRALGYFGKIFITCVSFGRNTNWWDNSLSDRRFRRASDFEMSYEQ